MIATSPRLLEAADEVSAAFNETSRRKIKPKTVLTVERSLRHGLPKPGLASALKLTAEQLDLVEALLNKYLKETD